MNRRVCCHQDVNMLSVLVGCVEFSLFPLHDGAQYCEHLTDWLNFYYDEF